MNGQPARHEPERSPDEVPDSLTLTGAISLGTGVMIGAGIFALIGQVAELAGDIEHPQHRAAHHDHLAIGCRGRHDHRPEARNI